MGENKKLKGLFVSPFPNGDVWRRDFQLSPYIKDLKEYGITIDVNHNLYSMRKRGIHKKYDFVMTEEVWLPKVHKRLNYIRMQGKKVFLISKEPFKTELLEKAYFFHKRWRFNNQHFFVPDAVFAPGALLASWWEKYTTSNVYITGYPRFDYYCDNFERPTREEVIAKYELEPDKKIIFFASYEPYIYVEEGDDIDPDIANETDTKRHGGSGYLMDLWDTREATLKSLEEFAKQNPEYQVVVKIHPMSWKCYKRGGGIGNEVSGTLKKYLDNPTPYMKVLGDNWRGGADKAKELLVAADIVTGWCSTMLLEAMLLKKPVIHILFGKTARINGFPEFERIFDVARTQDELHALLKNPNIGYDESMVEKYLHKVDGGTFRRIAESIRTELGLGSKVKEYPIVRPEMIPEDMKFSGVKK